jgi:hypothetical protein
MSGMVVERSAPQFMKPMPMGRTGEEVGRDVVWRRDWAVVRYVVREETSVPAPMKPMPPVGSQFRCIDQRC